MKKALWEAEMELSRAVEDLQTAVGTFNSKAAELQVRIKQGCSRQGHVLIVT